MSVANWLHGHLFNDKEPLMSVDPVVSADDWDNYVGEYDNVPIFISYDRTANQEKLVRSLTHCARIIIPIHHPNENGGPTKPESEKLWIMEDALCRDLTDDDVNCRLVGRMTRQGIRELVFQLADWESFRPVVGTWMLQNEAYEIDVSEHEGWTFVQNSIWPSSFRSSTE